MKSNFNKEEKEFIKNNVLKKTTKELTNLFNKTFNRNITTTQMNNYKKNNRIKSNIYEIFNEEEKQFIKENVVGIKTEELKNIFNKKFNRNVTLNQILGYKQRNKMKNELSFKFKKNQIPHNYKKIGSEFITNEGKYKRTFIKTDLNIWKEKERYLYEKYIGKIPKGSTIIFLDGNRNNFALDNLCLITKREKNILSSRQIYFSNKELNKTSIMIAKLLVKTKEND